MQPMLLWETAAQIRLMHTCLLVYGYSARVSWYMMQPCRPSNQRSQAPPLSSKRKLIGSCHWCVKLPCIGQRRQLDYLFFLFSILEQLPSALLLFLNEVLFPSAVLKDAAGNCSKPSQSYRFLNLSYTVIHICIQNMNQKMLPVAKLLVNIYLPVVDWSRNFYRRLGLKTSQH